MIATDTVTDQSKSDRNDVAARIWSLLESVADPEIPVLSIVDLGIVRSVEIHGDQVEIGLAPTYSGCPATEVIAATVLETLKSQGFPTPVIKQVLSPPWTTDWISEAGRAKLEAYGIAPPPADARSKRALFAGQLAIACPRCGSTQTTRVSEFGSTPCKASYKCDDCLEPFEFFKCL